jgi:hypothetical protein
MAKTQGGSTTLKTSAPKPPITSTSKPPSAKRGTNVASASDQQLVNQPADNKKKGVDDKEAPDQLNAGSQIGIHAHHFSLG